MKIKEILFIFIILFSISSCTKVVYFANLEPNDPQIERPISAKYEAKKPRIFIEDEDGETLTLDFACSFNVVELTAKPLGDQEYSWASRGINGNEHVYLSKPSNLEIGGISDYDGKTICVKFTSNETDLDNIGLDEAYRFKGKTLCGKVQSIEKEKFNKSIQCE